MKKALIIILFITCVSKAQVNVKYYKTLNGVKTDSFIVVQQPDWKGLQGALYNSDLFSTAISVASPNAFSALLKCITDGENGNSTPGIFLYLLGLCNITWTAAQKAELNGYFVKYYFAIQVS